VHYLSYLGSTVIDSLNVFTGRLERKFDTKLSSNLPTRLKDVKHFFVNYIIFEKLPSYLFLSLSLTTYRHTLAVTSNAIRLQ